MQRGNRHTVEPVMAAQHALAPACQFVRREIDQRRVQQRQALG
jgi:hypothetical protein